VSLKLRVILCLFFVLFSASALCAETITIPCEVLESSGPFISSSDKLNGIRVILIHHANAKDREILSRWLKDHSGTEIKFTVNKREYKGTLCRLAHCFGRGLLIYTDDINMMKRDIIEITLPFSDNR